MPAAPTPARTEVSARILRESARAAAAYAILCPECGAEMQTEYTFEMSRKYATVFARLNTASNAFQIDADTITISQPDKMSISAYNASNENGVETIRRVIKSSLHQPLFTDIRIIFLDESDGLTPQAQDMLRKPLEDRKSTRFILSANNDNFIKPIRSRCVVFEFGKIKEDAIRRRLEYIVDREGLSLNGEVKEIASNCDGDMRLAINELEKASHHSNHNGEELLETIRNMEIQV